MAVHRSDNPLVTVVIPVRNEERWLGRALRSVQRQTVASVEVLVVDDGSTDGTADVVARFSNDRRVRYLGNEGTGFTAALNTGLAAARAPFVARLDADDLWRPRRLEAQLAEFDANPQAVALGSHGWRINELGLPVGRLRTGPVGPAGYHARLLSGWPINLTHSSVLFRTALALRVGGYRAEYYPAEDMRLWNDLAAHGHVYALGQPLVYYRLRLNSISVDDVDIMYPQVARINAEVRRAADRPGRLDPDRFRVEHTRRAVYRAIANGRFVRGWRLARAGGLGAADWVAAARRAVRG